MGLVLLDSEADPSRWANAFQQGMKLTLLSHGIGVGRNDPEPYDCTQDTLADVGKNARFTYSHPEVLF
jgi:hypothetical protein